MNIGVDMDNTICSTSEKILEYEEKFLIQKNVDNKKLWDNEEIRNEFLNTYLEKIYEEALLKNYVKDVFDELRKGGNKIYIITARSEKYVYDIFDSIKKYLNKYDILVDGVFINAKDKVDVCLDEHIDLMIEDSLYNYNKLMDNNIFTILFDENCNNLDIDNRVSSWKEVISKIDD